MGAPAGVRSAGRLSDLTPQEIAKWRELRDKHGLSYRAIATRYGVSLVMIRRAIGKVKQEEM